MVDQGVFATIKRKVCDLEREYQQTKGLILSESDLKCLLFHKLFEDFSQSTPTMNNHITAIALHTEIPWYDRNDKLTLRPDITILNPRYMSILHGVSIERLPSKGFEFGGPTPVVIEVKFVKKKRGISKRDIKEFEKDAEKILCLAERLNSEGRTYTLLGVMVIFNKTDQTCPEFSDFLEKYNDTPNLKIIYGTGQVSFSNINSDIVPHSEHL
jgi:hypothetical protein